MTIVDIVTRNAKKFPKQEAICEIIDEKSQNSKSITWMEFEKISNQIANYLIENGIVKGTKIAIVLPNCLEWLPLFFGILKTGAIAVPINHHMMVRDILYCLKLSECTGIVFSDFINASEIFKNLSFKVSINVGSNNSLKNSINYHKILEKYSSDFKNNITLNDFATIHFSSGTTGFPKAILHKHYSYIFSGIIESFNHYLSVSDSFLCLAPLFHAGVKMHWLGHLLNSNKLVILNDISPTKIISAISNNAISVVWMPVPLAQNILSMVKEKNLVLSDFDLTNWRLVHMGSQPIAPSLISMWKTIFPNMDFDISYGLTEAAGPGCINLGSENIEKMNSIGKSSIFWESRVVNENFQDMPAFITGELIVKGPGVMDSYYKDRIATNTKIKDGWLFTGDIGYKDEQDFVYLVSRKNDIIISGGINIYPIQIENYIKKHPSVKDVAIIGIEDLYYGEVVVAVIELNDKGCTSKDLRTYCKRLPFYEQPKKYIFASIPKNQVGKTDKRKLKELYKKGEIK